MGKVLPSTVSHLGNSVKKERRPVKDKEEVKWAVIHYRKNTLTLFVSIILSGRRYVEVGMNEKTPQIKAAVPTGQ